MEIRTLLLEDEPAVRSLLEAVLTERGHKVYGYDTPLNCPFIPIDGSTCDKECSCVDFILTDNKMPGMTGLEFIKLQFERGCKLGPHNKAIFSGAWQPDELEQARQLGCSTFTKPFNLSEFCQWLAAGEQQLLRMKGPK